MRRTASLLLIASLLLLSRAAGAFELGDLDWALGAWRTPVDGAVMQKYFFHPDAGTFFIFTRVVSGEQTVYWDFITLDGEGSDYRLTQYSNGQKGDSYKLVESGKDFAVFRNPASRKVV